MIIGNFTSRLFIVTRFSGFDFEMSYMINISLYLETLLLFFSVQREPSPGSYKVKQLSTPTSTDSPPFISSAERFDKRARKFFTGQTVSSLRGWMTLDRF